MTHSPTFTLLAALLRRLAPHDLESWARSKVAQRAPQLVRFLFLRQAFRGVIRAHDSNWIREQIMQAEADPDGPHAGVGHALRSLRARGATAGELTALVRGMQTDLLFRLCYVLDHPLNVDPELETAWGLFQVDAHGRALEPIRGLHLSVFEADPALPGNCARDAAN